MIQEPPPEFNHFYPGPLIEWIMSAPKVDELCRIAGAKAQGQIVGCQFAIGAHCFIVLSAHAVLPLRQHEIAHCNGWRHE